NRATSGSVGFCPALLSVLPISRRTTTCAHATTQTTNAVPMAQLGIIHTLHPLRDCCAAKRRRSESNRRIEVLQLRPPLLVLSHLIPSANKINGLTAPPFLSVPA